MPKLRLDRQTLAKFLPDQPAIRAFEKVLEYVGDTGPDGVAEILALINGLRRDNTSAIAVRVAELDQQPAQRANLSSILARLESLEAQAQQRANLTAILARLEKLEQLTGV